MIGRAQHRRHVPALTEGRQVLAGREAAARTRDDDRAYLGIPCLLQRGLQILVHAQREGVQLVGPVERDRLDGPVARDLDLGHG